MDAKYYFEDLKRRKLEKNYKDAQRGLDRVKTMQNMWMGKLALKITFLQKFFRGWFLVERCINPAIFMEKYPCILE